MLALAVSNSTLLGVVLLLLIFALLLWLIGRR